MSKFTLPEDAREVHFRKGADPFGNAGWRGMNTESDPGALQPNELQLGRDIRLVGGHIEGRPGLSLIADLGDLDNLAQNGVHWMDEFGVTNPYTRLWLIAEGCFGFAAGTGAQIIRLDTLSNPKVQVYANFSSETSYSTPLASYGDRLMAGNGNLLQEIFQITPPYGVTVASIMPSPPQILIHDFTGYIIRCMVEFDGQLMIGLENLSNPALSKIVSWDGSSFSDDLTGIDPPLAFGRWHDKLIVGFSSATAAIKYRDMGDSPGTWTNVALAGFGCSTSQNAIVEDIDGTYIADGISKIFKFNGTVLSLVRTVGSCASLRTLCMHDNILHYGWNSTVTFASHLGRRDVDSSSLEYVDDYKNLTTDVAGFKNLVSMESYRSQIVCAGYGAQIIATAPNDVKGTAFSLSAPGASGSAFPINQVLRIPSLRA